MGHHLMRERFFSSGAPVVSNPPEKASIIGALSLLTAVSIRVHEALRSARSIFDISFFWAAAESVRTTSRLGPVGRTPRMSPVPGCFVSIVHLLSLWKLLAAPCLDGPELPQIATQQLSNGFAALRLLLDRVPYRLSRK